MQLFFAIIISACIAVWFVRYFKTHYLSNEDNQTSKTEKQSIAQKSQISKPPSRSIEHYSSQSATKMRPVGITQSPTESHSGSSKMAAIWLEQAQRQANILNVTSDPLEFRTNFEGIIRNLEELVRMEKSIKFVGSPQKDLNRLFENEDATCKDFITRYAKNLESKLTSKSYSLKRKPANKSQALR